MTPPPLSAVTTWVFDMDDTLYPPELGLWPQVSERITAYVMRVLGADHATALVERKRWAADYGTALAGLMAEHDVEPDPFLVEVHDIDLSGVRPDTRLAAAIDALPGRKVVYTNGSAAHGRTIAAALGLEACFAAFYGVDSAGYAVKPTRAAFEAVAARDGLDPARSAMVEDRQANLVVPAAMGMATIWRPANLTETRQDHVHHVAEDLATFLEQTREAA